MREILTALSTTSKAVQKPIENLDFLGTECGLAQLREYTFKVGEWVKDTYSHRIGKIVKCTKITLFEKEA